MANSKRLDVLCLTFGIVIMAIIASADARKERHHEPRYHEPRHHEPRHHEPQQRCVCTKEFDPVCASNGRLFNNVCLLHCYNKHHRKNLNVVEDYNCRDADAYRE